MRNLLLLILGLLTKNSNYSDEGLTSLEYQWNIFEITLFKSLP